MARHMEIKQDFVDDVEAQLHGLNFERVPLPEKLEQLSLSDLKRLAEILEAATKRISALENKALT